MQSKFQRDPVTPVALDYGGAAAEAVKFSDPDWTATGEKRAVVPFDGLATLWFNTGTLCNIACVGCYIESSPHNDALAYLGRSEARAYLAEAAAAPVRPVEIGFTGGEPFMNPDIIGMLEDALSAGFRVLVLTNAMKPMQRHKAALLDLDRRFRGRLTHRVSLDHFERDLHERVRGPRSWQPAIDGLSWLSAHGLQFAVAGRVHAGMAEADLREGYQRTLARLGISLDTTDQSRLVLFPDMDAATDVPEISVGCWGLLGKRPAAMMCASSRMVIKRRGAAKPVVVSCTLLPYDAQFEMGATLAEAARPVSLMHRHCATFCVLGGASCSVTR